MVYDVGRILTQPTEVAGYRVPAGVMVTANIGLVHSSANQYPNPERFDPDRMLGATLSPSTWLPFGGGNRRCPGATYAMVEMHVVLTEVLRRVELSTTTAPGERQKVKASIIYPHRGARIRVRAMRDVASASPVVTQTATCPVTSNTTPAPTASPHYVAGANGESVGRAADSSS